MSPQINLMYTRTFHPMRVNGDAIQALGLWLKENGSRKSRLPDLRSVLSERYPVGLFSEDEVHALCDLLKN
ncbi:hypothetical protein [Pseudomonas sp. Marseille-Q1929]|uniref:hypothetical protein n=1 Tax=Pseudomonas sp. Marseille-Q1929 TaxID=2730402 RepID=UPI001A8D2C40|nr:hypothetical protein [Pseudomonas sp. Marseille-Q1929]MBO0493083.1 hypothetical protein [Pseudomonas sp. Marseille-Q1929]